MRGLEIRKLVCFIPLLYYTTYKCKHVLWKTSSHFDLSLFQKKKGQVKHWCSQQSGISGTPVRTTFQTPTNPQLLTIPGDHVFGYSSTTTTTTTTTSSGIHSLWSSLTHSNIYLAVIMCEVLCYLLALQRWIRTSVASSAFKSKCPAVGAELKNEDNFIPNTMAIIPKQKPRK